MGYFLADALRSWYRPGDEYLINLQRVSNLDTTNLALFNKMVAITSMPGWNDQRIFELICWLDENGYLSKPAEIIE